MRGRLKTQGNIRKSVLVAFVFWVDMPAVDIKRFTKESAGLLSYFDRPADFIVAIHSLYEQYSNRTIRSKPSPMVSVLSTYQVPLPILRHLEYLLTKNAIAQPEAALELIKSLWEDEIFESRYLAGLLIGKISLPTSIIGPIITSYVKQSSDRSLLLILLTNGLQKIRELDPDGFLQLMFEWRETHDDKMTINAFNALIFHINDDDNINLPEIINIITLPIRSAPAAFQFILIDLIKAIYAHSEVETIFFIRQLFFEPFHPMTPVVIRRILPSLPSEIKPIVQDLLRTKSPLFSKKLI